MSAAADYLYQYFLSCAAKCKNSGFMKLNKMVGWMAIAGVCSTSLISLPVMAQEIGNDATVQTKTSNDALYKTLHDSPLRARAGAYHQFYR